MLCALHLQQSQLVNNPGRLAAIEKIANVANSEDIPFFLVGAMARDFIFFEGHNIKNKVLGILDNETRKKNPILLQICIRFIYL